jgi:hypothetical protein
MPGSYRVVPEHRFVFSRGWGVLTEGELLAHSQAIAQDPRFEPTFTQLSDLCEVTRAVLNADGIRKVALASPFRPGAQRAFAGTSDAVYGLARMCVSLAASPEDEVMVFRDLEAAARWLGSKIPENWREIAALPPDWVTPPD